MFLWPYRNTGLHLPTSPRDIFQIFLPLLVSSFIFTHLCFVISSSLFTASFGPLPLLVSLNCSFVHRMRVTAPGFPCKPVGLFDPHQSSDCLKRNLFGSDSELCVHAPKETVETWLSSTERWISCFSRPWQVLAFQVKNHQVVILLIKVLLRKMLNYINLDSFPSLRLDFSAPDLRAVGSYTRFLTMVLLSVNVKVLWRLFHAGPSHVSKKTLSLTSGKGARSIWTPASDDLSTC